MNKRGPGRPKGARGRYKKSRRDITKTVRFSEAEWRLISEIAEFCKESTSELIRKSATAYAKKVTYGCLLACQASQDECNKK